MWMGITSSSYFWASCKAVICQGCSTNPEKLGSASFPEGKITINRSSLIARCKALMVSRLRFGDRNSSLHSTGMIISASPGEARIASLFATNMISCRISLIASHTAIPSAIPAGWFGVTIAAPEAGIYCLPVTLSRNCSKFDIYWNVSLPRKGAMVSAICTARS